MPDSVTQILRSGPVGAKKNIAVLGDGFANADQAAYNDKVKELLIDGVFGHDYFYEDMQAFNIFRVNLISTDSGVSRRVYDEKGTPTDGSDDTITSTTLRNTALGYIYSGSWAHCWLENGANTSTLVQDALNTWVPDYDLVLIILNEPGFGGCGGGGFQIVTLGSSWQVMAHEFGHGAGGLADEYCQPGTYSGGEPGAVNVTINTDRLTLKWGRFVAPSTPVATGVNPNPGAGGCTNHNQGTKPAGWSSDQDVGLFEGGQYVTSGKYRPVENCRMRGNSPPYCPVCYTEMKMRHHAHTSRNFLKCYAGDFNGDGRSDLLVHNGNGIMIYRSDGKQLDLVFSAVDRVPGSWQFKLGDQFHIGDFNGDGKDEIAVYNSTDWAVEYLGLLADDGANGLRLIARYDDKMPGWQFQRDDKFHVADFNGDGKKDLYVFNGANWSIAYLGMLASDGAQLSMARRYDGNAPGWQMRRNDRHYVADLKGDGKQDLFVYNSQDWFREYLGTMVSSGAALSCAWKHDWVGEWNLGGADSFIPCNFEGTKGRRDLFVHNRDWFGMIRAVPTLSLQRLYYRWIHNYRHGRNW